MSNTIKIVIFICVLATIINYALHVSIINQDEELRNSALNYVATQCPSQKTNEWSTNNLNINFSIYGGAEWENNLTSETTKTR
jgi:hypothetical protein